MRRAFLLLALATLVCPGAVAPAAPNEPAISALYARGLAGDRQAVIDCIAALEKVLERTPNDQVARVYLGSACTLRSRDLSIGPGKLTALRKGIALMDEAAAAVPENAGVQLTRAVTNQALPGFLGRRKIARQQLDELVAMVARDPAKLTPPDRQLLYLNAGAAAKNAGEAARARELWQKGLALKASPQLTQEIAASLAQL